MEQRIDPKLTNGLTVEGSSGNVLVSSDNLVTFAASGGVIRRTRWIWINPGDTVEAFVEMKGGPGVSLRLYESTGETTENLLSYVESDSLNSMKLQSISYTLPVTAQRKLIGVGFYANNVTGKFFRPRVNVNKGVDQPPALIASGLVNTVNGAMSGNFLNYGVASSAMSGNKVKITLSQQFKSTAVRPLPFATDVTPSIFQHGNRLICSDVSISNGVLSFDIYFVNSSGAVVTPPANSSAQFLVYY